MPRRPAGLSRAGILRAELACLADEISARREVCRDRFPVSEFADGITRAVPLAVSWSLTERYVTHEIVHTYGVGHANSLSCRKATLAADAKPAQLPVP